MLQKHILSGTTLKPNGSWAFWATLRTKRSYFKEFLAYNRCNKSWERREFQEESHILVKPHLTQNSHTTFAYSDSKSWEWNEFQFGKCWTEHFLMWSYFAATESWHDSYSVVTSVVLINNDFRILTTPIAYSTFDADSFLRSSNWFCLKLSWFKFLKCPKNLILFN